MIYHNDKASTEAVKKFLKPTPGIPQVKPAKGDRKGPASTPSNRHLPIRGAR
jgi:hypothetical protein